MRKIWLFNVLVVSAIIVFTACNSSKNNDVENNTLLKKTPLKYAEGFEIEHYANHKKLIIKNPYQGAAENFTFKLVKNKLNKNEIQIPLTKIVATSTTHIPMLELLGVAQKMVGFPSLNYISSKKTRALIEKNLITDVGNPESMNVETLLNLQPDAVIGFSISSNNELGNTLHKMQIPYIYNGDWLEKTPLGRTEWIKFFGVLFDKEAEADSIFNTIEANYISAKKIAKKSTKKPSVLAGGIFKDVWYMPAGNSYEAQFLEDANTNYLWKNTTGNGSLALNLENVFEKGKDANIWLSPGFFNSLKELKKANSISYKLNAFQNKQVYSNTITNTHKGGIIYFELSPTRPDLVLKDLIKIAHPNLLPNYEFTFYKKLE